MSQTYTLRGRVAAISEPRTTPAGYTFQTLLVDTDDPQYPQRIPVEFAGDRIHNLVGLSAAQTVEVTFALRGREHDGRHYVSLRGWAVRGPAAAVATATPIPATPLPSAPAAPAPAPAAPERVEDLPF